MKASIIYHSVTGNTKRMAEIIAQSMEGVGGVEVRTFPIDAVDDQWVIDSDAVIFGSPAYYADLSAAMKTFLEGCKKYKLAGKLGGAFATANHAHGGGSFAIQTMLTHMMVYGMMVYSGGGAFGQPVIHVGPVGVAGFYDRLEENFRLYGQRFATKAVELFN